MNVDKLFAPRRVDVCGSSKGLPQAAVEFCVSIGGELAKIENVVIVSGSALRRAGTDQNDLATDWHIVNAAEQDLRERFGPDAIDARIETVVADDPTALSPSIKSQPDEQFHIGTLRRARGKTREARRISLSSPWTGFLRLRGGPALRRNSL